MFVSGREALSSVEDAISGVRSNEARLDGVLRSATEVADRQRQQLAESYRALALVRLDALVRNEVVGDLDAAERRAVEILRGQKTRLDQLLIRHAGATQKVRNAEADHRAKTVAVEEAHRPIEVMGAEVEARLAADPVWTAQHDRVDAIAKIAQAADDKAKQAEADRETKGKPYEADPLFMYLWRRKFGTASYKAGNFARFMDRWVARLVGYDAARPNYTMLNEIPARLREHATQRAAEYESEDRKLGEIERKALEAAGIGPLEAALTKAQAALAAATKTLADAQSALSALDAERTKLVEDGDRRAHDEALSVLSQAIAREDLQTLYREALATRTGDDDKLVQHIDEAQRNITKADQEVARIRDEMREIARRRGELEGVRNNFRSKQYDAPWSGFELDKGELVGNIIGGIVNGAIQGAVLWSLFERGHRRQGGWDQGQWPSGQSWPGTSMPRMRLPSSSLPRMGRGGGGFRTGGRF